MGTQGSGSTRGSIDSISDSLAGLTHAWEDETAPDEYYAVYTVQLGQLHAEGLLDFGAPRLDWSSSAIDIDQFNDFNEYFLNRFYWREIAVEPFGAWCQVFKRKMIFEIMPKYKPMLLAPEPDPLVESKRTRRHRDILSNYPQTLLSGNSDYASSGSQGGETEVVTGAPAAKLAEFARVFTPVHVLMGDDLESLFISMYTANL